VLAAVTIGATGLPAAATAATPHATVDAQLISDLTTRGSTSFMVYLRDRAKLSSAARLRDADAKAVEVHKQLTGTAARSQQGLRADLDRRGARYTSYWIANALRVEGDRALVDAIAARPEVERVEAVKTYQLVKPTEVKAGTKAVAAGPEWGLANIEAPKVWSEFGVRGEGVTVANIDTGVEFTHPALVGTYRGNLGNGSYDHNYNWFDPAHVCPDNAPCDNNGHGSHTMGTMVGDDGAGNQTGVAPGAKWIAAKGCESNSCSNASLLAAGQWVLAPTDLNGQNPRPELHADVVNNSWGGGQNDLWYQQTVAAWRAAGMFPTFSNGNDGPGCGTAGSPGDNPNAYAVGAYDINNTIADFSSRGASTVDGAIKPNIAAPGANIRSSVPGGGYANYSGTSMAAPHLSGAVALIWSAAPSLKGDVAATESLLDDTATDVDSTGCGGTADDNNNFGEGRLNAYQAVTAAPRGPVGRVGGAVTNAADGKPVAGATVTTDGRSATSGADGKYALTLSAGAHTLTATAYGFATKSATVTVPEGGAVTVDLALTASPMVTVSGVVTDGTGHHWPLYAKIEVTGRPGGPVFTDPVTGRYSFQVPGDSSYKLTTTARYPGYRTVDTDVVLAATNRTVDVPLPVDASCTAPGYQGSLGAPVLTQGFDGQTTPAGWSVVSRTTGGGWLFNDFGGRGNKTGGSGNFAIVDSDKLGGGKKQDSDLRSPVLDLSGSAAPLLSFASDFRALGSGDSADVDVSTDGGTTWTTVWHQTADRRGPRVEEVPLTAAAGSANAMLRFRYQGGYAWWWQVDDVKVVNRDCAAVPGGLVVGTTTDKNTGAPVNGVTVASADKPADRGVSAATPEDANLGDGFYWLFSSLTGNHRFTGSKPPYQVAGADVAVPADGAVRADLVLAAGRLTVSKTEIEAYQPYDSTRTATVTLTNTGSAPAQVEMLEQPGGFDLLSRTGAARAEHRMKGLVPTRDGVRYGAAGAPAAAAPKGDDAWARVADLPADLFDNAAATLDGKVYTVGGGSGTGAEKKAWVYDPADDAWSALPDMPSARSKPTAAAVGGKLYVIGGWGASGTVGTVDVFDPRTGAWSTVAGATNPAPAAAVGGAVADGKVYLVGGCADTNCTFLAKTVVFDPATGQFSTGADYPHPVAWMSCGGVGGQVYCAGGTGDTEYTDGFAYDTRSGQWSPIPDMPADMWGAQYAAAGGMLVIAGGVTGGSTAVTNRTLGYDPAARAWKDLPNAQFSRYRGAGACGAYRIGGSPTSFVGSKETEKLAGLEQCVEAGDVPWLSTSPTTFTLAPGKKKTVTVSLTATAAAGVAQPGTYTAKLGVRSDTPYPVPGVQVSTKVQPPATWTKLRGTVTGQPCGAAPVGVRATVRLNSLSNPGTGVTLTADSQGRYAYWLPEGRYQMIVAKDGWIPVVKTIKLSAGFTSTRDVVLGPVSPCDSRAGGI
jgi:subtilisin family serine protease